MGKATARIYFQKLVDTLQCSVQFMAFYVVDNQANVYRVLQCTEYMQILKLMGSLFFNINKRGNTKID